MATEEGAPPVEPREPRLAVTWAWAEHLGTGLTVGYLAMVVIGMFHLFIRFFRFGINILDFAEPSDFLLAPVRDPLVMVATVVPAVVIWWYMTGAERLGQAWRQRRRQAGKPVGWWETREENVAKVRRYVLGVRWLTAILWVTVASLWYERRAADRIMMGHGDRVTVETTGSIREEGTDRRPLMLLGTSGRFVFLFRTEDWRTIILPTENVLRIVPVEQARGLHTVRPRFLRRFDSTSAASPP